MEYKIALGTKDEYVTPFTIAKWEDVPMFSHSFYDKEYNVENEHRIDEMLFHSDWNWLMSVVDKIESIIFDENNSYNVTIGSTNYCVIQDSNGDTFEIIKDDGKTKLETVYNAVVEFIKFYNEKQK